MVWRTNFDRVLEACALPAPQPAPQQQPILSPAPQAAPQQQPWRPPSRCAESSGSAAWVPPGALARRPGSAQAQVPRKAAVAAAADPSAYAAGRYMEPVASPRGSPEGRQRLPLLREGGGGGGAAAAPAVATVAAATAPDARRAAVAPQPAAGALEQDEQCPRAAAAAAAVGLGPGAVPEALASALRDIVFKLDHIATVRGRRAAAWVAGYEGSRSPRLRLAWVQDCGARPR
jgi:hypothetical protein